MSNSTTFEQKLFKAADKLRKNIDAAEYKYVVLGLRTWEIIGMKI